MLEKYFLKNLLKCIQEHFFSCRNQIFFLKKIGRLDWERRKDKEEELQLKK
jgi:hypothetical protein